MGRRFEGKVALVTGGGAGIGQATAECLGSEGARLVLLDRSREDLDRASAELGRMDVEHVAVLGDVAEPADCRRAVDAALEHWSGIDVLVANAAVRAHGSILEASDEDWDRVLSVNLRGVADVCTAAASAMRTMSRGGALVLVSSQYAVMGRDSMPIYDAAKAGVVSLARSLAVELAPDGIRVNSICPGLTITDYHLRRTDDPNGLRDTEAGLLRRAAEPSEVASAIAFLASSDASYVTATNLMVDAGGHAVGSS